MAGRPVYIEASRGGRPDLGASRRREAWRRSRLTSILRHGGRWAKASRNLTGACTRPPTRWLSCSARDAGRRVMPGVRLLMRYCPLLLNARSQPAAKGYVLRAAGRDGLPGLEAGQWREAWHGLNASSRGTGVGRRAKAGRHLTSACTRPPTRGMSSAASGSGRRVMRGVRCRKQDTLFI